MNAALSSRIDWLNDLKSRFIMAVSPRYSKNTYNDIHLIISEKDSIGYTDYHREVISIYANNPNKSISLIDTKTNLLNIRKQIKKKLG